MANNITPQQATELIYRSMLTGVPTSEFDAAGGYDAVYNLAKSSGADMGKPSAQAVLNYGAQVPAQGYGNKSYAPGFDLVSDLRNRGATEDQIKAAGLGPGETNYYQQAQNTVALASPAYLDLQAKYNAMQAGKGQTTTGTSTSTGQANPYSVPTGVTTGSRGTVDAGGSNINPGVGLIASAITGNVNPGSGILNSNAQLTPPKAATAQLPPGATPKTEGGMGYNTGNTSTKAGVENWYNALTGQSRVVVPGGFIPPDANWKKL